MKSLLAILAFCFITIQANAADFQATAIYCNGPVSNGDVSACPAFSSWMGISLKDLKLVSIPVNSTDSFIRLQDGLGNVWEQRLEACNAKPSALRGCRASVDFTKPGQVSVHISVWDIGRPEQDLGLFVQNNQLSLVTDGGDNLMFSLTAHE